MEPSSDAVRDAVIALRLKKEADAEAFRILVESSKVTWEAEVLLAFESLLQTSFPSSLLRSGIQLAPTDGTVLVQSSKVLETDVNLDAGLRAIQKGLEPVHILGDPTLVTERAKYRIDLLRRMFTVLQKGLGPETSLETTTLTFNALTHESSNTIELSVVRSQLLDRPGIRVHNYSKNATPFVTYSEHGILQWNTIGSEKPNDSLYPYWRIPSAWNHDTLPFQTQCPTCKKQNRLMFASPVGTRVKSVVCPSGHYEWIALTNKVTPRPANPYKQMIRRAEATIKALQTKIDQWKKMG
jgi:hypothetical protein